MISEISGFNFNFPAEYLKAALILSLLTVWVLVGLFFYLNLYTKRRYFSLWTAAWLFYALWLTLCISLQNNNESAILIMLKQWCVSASAVCLLWGSSVFHNLRPRQTLFGLFIVFLFVWSYFGAYHLEDRLHVQIPIFGLIGLASLMTAWAFYKFRLRRDYIGAGLLAVGFFFWGIYLATYPFVQNSEQLICTSFLISAVLQLFIAVSMIILVLEEVRSSNKLAFQQLRSQKSEQAVLQKKVLTTEERYRSLFDQAHEGIIIATSESLQIVEMNQTARQLFGVYGTGMKHPNLDSFFSAKISPEPGPQASAEWFNWISQQPHLNLVRIDGGVVPVEVDGARIELEGKPAYQFFFRELTERTRLEQQLRQAERLSAIGQMISGVAHELNNPLAVIMGYLELILARHELSGQTRVDLEKVAQESSRAAKLVSNFLSFAREQPAHREMVDFNKVIDRVVELRHSEIKVTGIDLELELEPQLPRTLAEPDQLQQVLVILVNNALQAMLDAPAPGRLKIVTQNAGKLLKIKVIDNGPGVPPAIASRIFEPFFTTKEVGTGTGLGLSIAHSIMAEHQGRIYCEPAPGSGACFVLEFPLVTAQMTEEKSTPAPADQPAAQPETAPARPARILVLDDEKSIAELLSEMLGLLGHTTTVCHAGAQALEELDKAEFDVILSDFRMPGMDGQKFFKLATQKHPGVAHRIIFLTGDIVNEDTRAFLHSAGAPFLGKPFHLDKVEQAVARILSETPAAAACH